MTRWLVIVAALAGCKKDFEDYQRGSAGIEGKLALRRLAQRASDTARLRSYPRGEAGPSPANPCCQHAGSQCDPSPSDWSDPVWDALSFKLDVPTRFQFTYESDGKTFTATAAGDPLCDGHPVSFSETGKLDAPGKIQLAEHFTP
jgi:hypothetical protein